MKCSFCGAWEQDIDCSTMENTYVYHALEEGKKYGYKVVTLTGGEPLLHRDIKNIIQYASKLGYWVCITTNGLAIDREIIDVVKSNKCILRVSLHTLHLEYSQMENEFMGVSGSDAKKVTVYLRDDEQKKKLLAIQIDGKGLALSIRSANLDDYYQYKIIYVQL